MTTEAKNNILINFIYYLFFNIWFGLLTILYFGISSFTLFWTISKRGENWIYYNVGGDSYHKDSCFSYCFKFVNLKSFSKEPLRDMIVEALSYREKSF